MEEQAKIALQGIIEGAIQVKDFVLDQAPEVIQQLLAWEMVSSLVCMIVGILLLASIPLDVKIGIKAWKNYEKAPYNSMEASFNGVLLACNIVYIIPALVFGIGSMNLTWLQILIAPKVFLLEYAAGLV